MSARQAIERDAAGPRRPPRGQKADLFKWVNDQQHLDMRTKFILKELAAYADADCCAWSKVDDLAYSANCSTRTVQYHLAALIEARLIKPTGRTHRLDGSTRSVPVYQLAPEVEGLGAEVGMGAKIAPIDGPPMGEAQVAPMEPAWVQSEAGMGATGLHPAYGKQGEQSGDKSPSPGARDADFVALERAVPKGLLKYADRGVAFAAFTVLIGQGVSLERLTAAAGRMAADTAFRSRKFPPPLEDWLAKGQWRGWDGEDAGAAGAPPALTAVAGWTGPAELRAAVVAATDEAFARSYLDTARYDPGPPARLVVRTGMAAERLQRVRGVLKVFDVVVERERA